MVEKWCRSVSYTRKRLSRTGNVFSSHLAMRYRLFTALLLSTGVLMLIKFLYQKPKLSLQLEHILHLSCVTLNAHFQGTTCRGCDPSRVRLGKHPRREGTRRESRISGTSCRGYEFAGVRLVQLPTSIKYKVERDKRYLPYI